MLLAESDEGCSDSTEMELEVVPNPEMFLGNDTTVKVNHQIVLKPKEKFDSYLWSDNSTEDSLLVSSAYVGKQTVWLTVTKNGCNGSDTINIYFDSNVAIRSLIPYGILMYPNPVADKIRVLLLNGYNDVMTYEIADLSGKIIVKGFLTEKFNEIPAEFLRSGLYFITLFQGDNIFREKFVKY